ncbi:hypothetical protein BN938_1795 [Mucinivorans hirudinis]|uniref:Uncharacterized protein n=1 Tax=Mucinivorans hirudinis TaxID=1433126 RepID=A0A060R8N4_9BACT|nr:hypothetical protein BN938_1795 [Mucinivorans hirudinis]
MFVALPTIKLLFCQGAFFQYQSLFFCVSFFDTVFKSVLWRYSLPLDLIKYNTNFSNAKLFLKKLFVSG